MRLVVITPRRACRPTNSETIARWSVTPCPPRGPVESQKPNTSAVGHSSKRPGRAAARRISGVRGRPPSPCSPAVACRAIPLRARFARRTRRRIFAANTSPDIRGEWWRPPRRRRLLRCVRRRGYGDPRSRPPLRGTGASLLLRADASSRLASPAGATRGRGQRRRRRRPRRRNGCGLKQAVLRFRRACGRGGSARAKGWFQPFVRSRGRGGGRIRSAEPRASLAARRRRGGARAHAAPRYTAPA